MLRPARGSLFSREEAAAMKTEELLRTASRLFNRKGIDATSLDEIGAAVGATKSVVYHYLTDKPDLVAQCYRRAFALGDKVLAAMEEVEGDGFARAVAGYRPAGRDERPRRILAARAAGRRRRAARRRRARRSSRSPAAPSEAFPAAGRSRRSPTAASGRST